VDEAGERSFERFVAAEGGALLRFAYLLTGGRDATESLLQRDELLRALRTLSPRQRVVVVLRYVEDLSEVDTAALLDCSVGSASSARAGSPWCC
jgi:DNA-directed RNA polymerase specialized sigma24 family protein